jgi:hypothetical protein
MSDIELIDNRTVPPATITSGAVPTISFVTWEAEQGSRRQASESQIGRSSFHPAEMKPGDKRACRQPSGPFQVPQSLDAPPAVLLRPRCDATPPPRSRRVMNWRRLMTCPNLTRSDDGTPMRNGPAHGPLPVSQQLMKHFVSSSSQDHPGDVMLCGEPTPRNRRCQSLWPLSVTVRVPQCRDRSVA